MYTYKTQGTCAREILFDVKDGILTDISFVGGCMGNTAGVAALAKNRPVDEVIELIQGIECGARGTSCPDQLAAALLKYKQDTAE